MRIISHRNFFRMRPQWLLCGILFCATMALSGTSWANVSISPEELQQRVEQYVLDSTDSTDAHARLVVTCLRLPASPVQLKGENLDVMLEDSRITPIPFRTIVNVTLATESEKLQIGVPIKVMVEKPVWVAKHLIRAKSPITLKDVALQKKLLDHEASYALASDENVSQFIAVTNITSGQILDSRRVKVTPTIYRHDPVYIMLTLNAGIHVRLMGSAMEEGVIGQRIRVAQKAGLGVKHKIYTGKVIGKNTVLVNM